MYGLPETIENFTAFMDDIQASGIQPDIEPIVPIPVEPRDCFDMEIEGAKQAECLI